MNSGLDLTCEIHVTPAQLTTESRFSIAERTYSDLRVESDGSMGWWVHAVDDTGRKMKFASSYLPGDTADRFRLRFVDIPIVR